MDVAPYRLFAFWTGNNPMPEVRRECLETFRETDLLPVLITPENLSEWLVRPLHPAYEYLSPLHRSDYLRPYFMHYHGGGYSDIKRQRGRWLHWVENVLQSKWLIGAGYREIHGGTPWLQNEKVQGKAYLMARPVGDRTAKVVTNAMRGFYRRMIGNGAFYFKPDTYFTRYWLKTVEKRLDMLLPLLRKNPAQRIRTWAGDGTGYPVPWGFIQCGVFSPLTLLNWPMLARTLPAPSFENYGSDVGVDVHQPHPQFNI